MPADRTIYTKYTWVNDQSPLNAANLNNIEDGIYKASALAHENAEYIDEIYTAIISMLSISYNPANDTFVFTFGKETGQNATERFYVSKTLSLASYNTVKINEAEGTFVYAHNGVDQLQLAYSDDVVNSNLVLRTATGQVKVPETPVANGDATSKKYVDDADALKEDLTNKSTSLSNASTDTQYPSAKAVYDLVTNRATLVATLGNASQSLSGLMSSEDKTRLDALYALLGSEADSDTVVNTINEVLAIFNNYAEGADLVTALSNKADKVGPLPMVTIPYPNTPTVKSFLDEYNLWDKYFVFYWYTGTYIGFFSQWTDKFNARITQCGSNNTWHVHQQSHSMTFAAIITSNSYREDSELNTNKVTSLTSSSTDDQYPSAKCVYDIVSAKADLIDGKVPSAQLPSYVDDIVEFTKQVSGNSWMANLLETENGSIVYNNAAASAISGGTSSPYYKTFIINTNGTEAGMVVLAPEAGKIYVSLSNSNCYRWSGSDIVEVSKSISLGETSSTAYAGNKGKANAQAIAQLQTDVTARKFYYHKITFVANSTTYIIYLTNKESSQFDPSGNAFEPIMGAGAWFSITPLSNNKPVIKLSISNTVTIYYQDGTIEQLTYSSISDIVTEC